RPCALDDRRGHRHQAVLARRELDEFAAGQLYADALQRSRGDRGRHPAERLDALVAVAAYSEVDLSDAVQPHRVEDVDEQPEFDRVARVELQPLEQRAPSGIFTPERLGDAGELGPEQI